MIEGNFELKHGLIHLLPKFGGLAREDSNKHNLKFHVICTCMKTRIVTNEEIFLIAFPFSLADKPKYWLYYFLLDL